MKSYNVILIFNNLCSSGLKVEIGIYDLRMIHSSNIIINFIYDLIYKKHSLQNFYKICMYAIQFKRIFMNNYLHSSSLIIVSIETVSK